MSKVLKFAVLDGAYVSKEVKAKNLTEAKKLAKEIFNSDKNVMENVFSFGKYKAGIAREFDREMVGISDYEELVNKDFASNNPGGRVNIDDPVLIKALIAARLSEKQKTVVSPGKMIFIALVLLGLVVGFFMITGDK